MEEYDSKLGLYSSKNYLSEVLVEKFNNKYVEVEVFNNFSQIDLTKISYLIINLIDSDFNKNEILKIVETVTCKIIVLAPFVVKSEELSNIDAFLDNLIKLNSNLGVLLVPEIIGEAVKYNDYFVSHDLIMQSLLTDRIKVTDPKRILKLISPNKLADEIVKQTFSFGISGQKLLASGFNKSVRNFLTNFLKVDSINIIPKKSEIEFIEIKANSSKEVTIALYSLISKSKSEFKKSRIIEPEIEILKPVESIKKNVSKKKINLPIKKLSYLFLLFIFALILPAILLFASASSLFFATKVVQKDSSLSLNFINVSYGLASTANKINVGIPFYGESSNLIMKFSTILNELVDMSMVAKDLVDKINGDEVYDVQVYSDLLSASLDKIYTDISFLQGDLEGQEGFLGDEIRYLLHRKNIDIKTYKEKIYDLKNLTSRLSNVLGMDSSKKYLILFQNNMELRPTGGFIGSYALVTFDKGRMKEIVVSDVYTADGQLKGHIDPPAPIQKYLGEGGWFLRDSNWDPDFEKSALKAEWFLDKEVDQKVDGVISIDLFFIQGLLKVTGPILIADYNKTIDSNNLYLTTQSEVENQFFPGSIKKASFLTALSKNLITEVEKLNSDKYAKFFGEIYNSLEQRHIQVYLHDLNANEAVSNMGYKGEIDMNTSCNLRCVVDPYALIDANLGVNKSNLFIKRSQELKINLNRKLINHELLVTYENNAGFSVGPSGIYKTYTRIIVPKNAIVSGVRYYEESGIFKDLEMDVNDTDNGREVGFWFQTNPGSVSKIQIAWSLPVDTLDQGGEIIFKVRKQSGTDSDILKVNIVEGDLSLTGKSLSVYNTTLVKDFNQKIFVK